MKKSILYQIILLSCLVIVYDKVNTIKTANEIQISDSKQFENHLDSKSIRIALKRNSLKGDGKIFFIQKLY